MVVRRSRSRDYFALQPGKRGTRLSLNGFESRGWCSDLGDRRVQPVTAARVRCVGATSFPKFHDCGGASGRVRTAPLDAVQVLRRGVACRRSYDHAWCELSVRLGAPDSSSGH